MAKTADFIYAFTKLETALKEQYNQTVLQFETGLQETDADMAEKLKVCRILRNYVSHHSDSIKFVSVSDEQVAFLEDLANRVNGIPALKDCYQRLAPITQNTSREDLMKTLAKSKFGIVPVTDLSGFPIGSLSWEDAVKLFNASSGKRIDKDTLFKIVGKQKNLCLCNRNYTGEDIQSGKVIFVVDAGGLYQGIYKYIKRG